MRTVRSLMRRRRGEGPSQVFGATNDSLWLWIQTTGSSLIPELAQLIPRLPDPEVQRRFTGSSGTQTLREAMAFYRLVKELANQHRPDGYDGVRDVVEFGCGWGRMIRFFIKDVEPAHLTGIDCLPDVIEICESTNRWATFDCVAPTPPVNLPDEFADLVYAYSVFSHLSEETHLAWIEEFCRVLRPGGLLVATTRGRAYLDVCANLRNQVSIAPHQTGAAKAFVDYDGWVARYERGEYCHDPVGGGKGLSSQFFGETLIPRRYAEQVWKQWLPVVDYISDPARCPQDVIVARK
jgi:SAM-dependent methyltransferase